ncbi:MAG: prepilin peptidase [Rickettsiales bacterium]|nr:prepilin peptidase [Rickettsiales bacterium]
MLPITVYLIASMGIVLWLDVTRYIIPNWLVASLLLLYPLAIYLSPVSVDWLMALAGMGIIFAVGFALFAFRFVGGGDIKLLTVLALWVGWALLVDYMVLVTLLGGVLSVVLYVLRKLLRYVPKKKERPRILRDGEPVPYGVAIAFAMLYFIWSGQIELLPAVK